MQNATDEASAERQRLLGEARAAADALGTKLRQAMQDDSENLSQAMARRMQDEVFAIARKTLADLATTDLEERFCDVFIRRLHTLDEPAKASLGAALTTAAEPAVLRSALALPAEQRTKIQNAINKAFSADIQLEFETAPSLVGGIELVTTGQKVAWSIADYLTAMEKGVAELLKPKDKPKSKVMPKPVAKVEPASRANPAPNTEAEAKTQAKTAVEPEAGPTSKPVESKPSVTKQ